MYCRWVGDAEREPNSDDPVIVPDGYGEQPPPVGWVLDAIWAQLRTAGLADLVAHHRALTRGLHQLGPVHSLRLTAWLASHAADADLADFWSAEHRRHATVSLVHR